MNLKRAKDFLKNLGGEVRIFAHRDPDGCISTALLLAFLKNKKIKPVLFFGRNDRIYYETFLKKRADDLIFLDAPVDQYFELLKPLKGKNILVIDHHQISEDLNKFGFVHINPRFENPKAYVSAAQICYKILKIKNFEWLMRIGAVSDKALEGTKEENEAGDMIDAVATIKKDKDIISLAKFLSKCEKIEDFLYEERYRKIKEVYENEMEKQIALFELHGISDINWFELKGRYGITSSLATRLFDLYPNRTIFVYSKGKYYKVSGRSNKFDLGIIFKEAAKGLGAGGGHERAAGSEVNNFNEFKKRVMKMIH